MKKYLIYEQIDIDIDSILLINVYEENYFSLRERKIYAHCTCRKSQTMQTFLYMCDKTYAKNTPRAPAGGKMPCIR